MNPEEYFCSLEPNIDKRKTLVKMILSIMQPRINDTNSIVIVEGPPRSGKTTLIKLLMMLMAEQSVELHLSDVCRTWRSSEIRKIYPLRFVWIKNFSQRLSDLPMLNNDPQPVLVDEPYVQPTFRYIFEKSLNSKIERNISHHIIKLTLHRTFDNDKEIKLNRNRLEGYIRSLTD